MASMIPWKKKRAEAAAERKSLVPADDFPFFLSGMRDEFDRLLERFSRKWPSLTEHDGWRWGVEVEDEEDAVMVRAEAPGFEVGDFDVQVSDNRLVLRADKKVETKGEKGKPHEYREEHCYESITLPAGVDRDKVEAKYHNGVLTVRLAKTAESKAKRITVQST